MIGLHLSKEAIDSAITERVQDPETHLPEWRWRLHSSHVANMIQDGQCGNVASKVYTDCLAPILCG